MKPAWVHVEWSEAGGMFEQGAIIDFAKFEAEAEKLALAHTSGGYLKTMVTVHFDEGSTYQCRLDLGACDPLEKGFEHGIKLRLKHYSEYMARDMPRSFRENQEKLHAIWVQMDFSPDLTWCRWEVEDLRQPVCKHFCTLTTRH